MITRVNILIAIIFSCIIAPAFAQDTLLHEGFNDTTAAGESIGLPSGWTEEKAKGKVGSGDIVNWDFLVGGHNYSPDSTAEGLFNARFQFQSSNREATKLVTPPLSLAGKIKPVLKFWHAQTIWYWGSDYWDELYVYYKKHQDSSWVLLEEYPNYVSSWSYREIYLPEDDLTDTYYIGFEGVTGYGNGVCIDDVLIHETDVLQRFVESTKTSQPITSYVPTGTENNPIIRFDAEIGGNNGSILLNHFTVHMENSDNADIAANGVKLFYTKDTVFNDNIQLGSSSSISGDSVTFYGIDYSLTSGNNTFWVTFDISSSATADNHVDARVKKNGVIIGGQGFPSTAISPDGERLIYQTLFYDDFEGDSGWVYEYEFQRQKPQGLGGYSGTKTWGTPDPENAVSGDTVIGLDLTGLNTYHGNYELLDTVNFHYATSPSFNLFYFSDVKMKFERHLSVYLFDYAFIEYSIDDGATWTRFWRNSQEGGSIAEPRWVEREYDLKDYVDRNQNVKIRFGLGPTGAYNSSSGWNIDNFLITGNYVTKDVGISEWMTPVEACGLTSTEEVKIVVKNYGAQPSPAIIPVTYRFNDIIVHDTVNGPIGVGDSIIFSFDEKIDLSTPKFYSNVQVYTSLEGDEDTRNDKIARTFYSLPYVELPYSDDFEGEFSFWRPNGDTSSFSNGIPDGYSLTEAASGEKAWVTNITGYYTDNDSSWVESPCFDFSTMEKPIFEFYVWKETEDMIDGAKLMYSTNGGGNWYDVPKHGYNWNWNWYSDTVTSLYSRGWENTDKNWKLMRNVLPDDLQFEPEVNFRIVFTTNDTISYYEGFAFDKVHLFEAPHDVGVISIDSLSTQCQYVNNDSIRLSLKNYGIRPLRVGDTIIVGVDINTDTTIIDTLLVQGQDWIMDDTMQFQLTKRAPIQEAGAYTITAYPLMNEEPNFYISPGNDTATFDFTVLQNPITNLPDTLFSVFPDSLIIEPLYSEDYAYLWGGGSTDSVYDVPDAGQYTLTVTDTAGNGCITWDTIVVQSLIPDIGVDSILYPFSTCELGNKVNIQVQVKNFGTDTMFTGRRVYVTYQFESEPIVKDTVTLISDIVPGGTYAYTFEEDTVDMGNVTDYQIKAWSAHPYDSISENDTVWSTVTVFGYPTVDLGDDIVVQALDYTLDAGSDYDLYLWGDEDSTTTQTLYIDTSGYYDISVWDTNGCPAYDTIHVFLKVHDVSIEELVTPVTGCQPLGKNYVRPNIINNGTDTIRTGEKIPLKYILNESLVVKDTLEVAEDIAPGDYVVHTFTDHLPLDPDETYHLVVTSNLAVDLRPENDTIIDTVYIYQNPSLELGVDTVIRGTSFELDAGDGNIPGIPVTYLWNNDSTSQKITITNTGTYSVTLSRDEGCTGTDSRHVRIVYPDIGVTAITTPVTKCVLTNEEAVSINITNIGTDTVETGETIVAGYSVNTGEMLYDTIVVSNRMVPGDVMLYYFDEDADMTEETGYVIHARSIYEGDLNNANDTLSKDINHNGNPVVDLNAPEIVRAFSYELDAGAGEDFTYLWQDESTGQTFTATQSGIYHVKVTNSKTGCFEQDTATMLFIIDDLAVTSAQVTGTKCENSPLDVQLEITNLGNTNPPRGTELIAGYEISGKDTVSEVFQLESIFGSNTKIHYDLTKKPALSGEGNKKIKFFVLFPEDVNSSNDTLEQEVTILPGPGIDLEGGKDTITKQFPANLDAGGNYTSYLWSNDSDQSSITVETAGLYWVKVTGTNGCEASDTIYVKLETGVTGYGAEWLKIYPNPAREKLFVDITRSGKEIYILELVNSLGEVVMNKNIEEFGALPARLDISGLASGIYYLRINGNLLLHSYPIVITK